MRRFVCFVVVAASVAVIAAPASAASNEDFVVGSGEIVVGAPGHPPGPVVIGFSIDAHSDASGGNPGGEVDVFFVTFPESIAGGPVTCLRVLDSRAIIGFEDASAGHVTVEVFDGSAIGWADTFAIAFGQTGCFPVADSSPLVAGALVVHDGVPLTSKDQCKDGGWRDLIDDERRPFTNQGRCIAFVQSAT